jgi:catechol 2,3-dioxygenase-like lactoylglutathione lyase family enzyme
VASQKITTGAVHHLALTVTDLKRSLDFYTNLLGFQVLMELGPARVLLGNNHTVLALTTAADPSRAIAGDRFNENRVGLDHLSLSVASRAELERAIQVLDERGVSHGEIKDLGEGLGICVLAFRDPDHIQLELTSPRA